MKIVFLSRYQDSVARGVETYVSELSSRLAKVHDVEVFSGSKSDSLKDIIAGRFDLIIPTNGRSQALKASLSRLVNKSKVLISGQAGVGRDDIWNILITRPDVYVALTDFELKWSKKYAFRTKVVKIPNGVDLEKFNPKGEKLKVDLEEPIVLSVGALEWYKHHEKLIKAFTNLSKGSLLLVGKGSEYKRLLNLGNSILGNKRFKILDLDFADMPKVYRSVDLFSLPSWDREAFGIVYVEAMASGLGVVAPDDLARREIVRESGILVNVDDDKKYAQAISRALEKDWSNISLKQAELFSWDQVAKKYLKLIEEIFNEK